MLQEIIKSPQSVWLEITNRCNLRCSHCYNDSSPEGEEASLSREDFIGIIKTCVNFGFKNIQFIGGEPIASPHLIELLQKSHEFGFINIEVFTNLYVLPHSVVDMLICTGSSVATSFYSSDATVHDNITARPGSFLATSKNISRLLARGVEVRVGFIEMPSNEGHYEKTKTYLCDLGINNVGFDIQRAVGRAKKSGSPRLTELCGSCGDGVLSIDWHGNISPCIMSKDWTLGNIKITSLEEVFNGKILKNFRQDLKNTHGSALACMPEECVPQCVPKCSPNCSPCYPGGRCNPDLFG